MQIWLKMPNQRIKTDAASWPLIFTFVYSFQFSLFIKLVLSDIGCAAYAQGR